MDLCYDCGQCISVIVGIHLVSVMFSVAVSAWHLETNSRQTAIRLEPLRSLWIFKGRHQRAQIKMTWTQLDRPTTNQSNWPSTGWHISLKDKQAEWNQHIVLRQRKPSLLLLKMPHGISLHRHHIEFLDEAVVICWSITSLEEIFLDGRGDLRRAYVTWADEIRLAPRLIAYWWINHTEHHK